MTIVATEASVYERCVALADAGVPEAEIPDKVLALLSDDVIRHLALLYLRQYVRVVRQRAAKQLASAYCLSGGLRRMATASAHRQGFQDVAEWQRYSSQVWRNQLIAMNEGRRIPRGAMTRQDFFDKIALLERNKRGLDDTIEDLRKDIEFLRRTGFATVNEAVASLKPFTDA
jgi:hypothetical protein